MVQKGFSKMIWFLVILLVAISMTIGFLWWQGQNKEKLSMKSRTKVEEINKERKVGVKNESALNLSSKRMEVQLPPETIETRPTELEIYKNEKYGFMIEYFTDKLAVERDYKAERLVDNSRLLFDVFFYDSNYGVNAAETESIPVITIEIFECGEEDFNKCYDQIICGPRRYVRGPIAISYGSSYFVIDNSSTYSLSFAWNSQEEMRGIAVIKNQLLYVILVRTESTNFRPVPEGIFNKILSSFMFIKTGRGEINPDLVIQEVNWTPHNPTPEDTITFQIIVRNIGNKISPPTEMKFAVANYRNGSGKKIESIKPLEPEEKTNIFVKVPPSMIEHVEIKYHTLSFWIEIDPNNQVSELNEDNNIETPHIPFSF